MAASSGTGSPSARSDLHRPDVENERAGAEVRRDGGDGRLEARDRDGDDDDRATGDRGEAGEGDPMARRRRRARRVGIVGAERGVAAERPGHELAEGAEADDADRRALVSRGGHGSDLSGGRRARGVSAENNRWRCSGCDQ